MSRVRKILENMTCLLDTAETVLILQGGGRPADYPLVQCDDPLELMSHTQMQEGKMLSMEQYQKDTSRFCVK